MKAFATLNRSIFLTKTYKLGILGVSLEWFKSNLADRTQFFSDNDYISDKLPMKTGVPHRSVLGPSLFLLHLNDIASCSPDLIFLNVTNNTTVVILHDSLPELCAEANRELASLDCWLCLKRLSLNIDKTCHVIASYKKKELPINVSIRNNHKALVKLQKSRESNLTLGFPLMIITFLFVKNG